MAKEMLWKYTWPSGYFLERDEWLVVKNCWGTCLWEALCVFGDPSTSSLNSPRCQNLVFSLEPTLYDLKDHGGGEGPSEGC